MSRTRGVLGAFAVVLASCSSPSGQQIGPKTLSSADPVFEVVDIDGCDYLASRGYAGYVSYTLKANGNCGTQTEPTGTPTRTVHPEAEPNLAIVLIDGCEYLESRSYAGYNNYTLKANGNCGRVVTPPPKRPVPLPAT